MVIDLTPCHIPDPILDHVFHPPHSLEPGLLIMQDASIRSATNLKVPGGFQSEDHAVQATSEGYKDRSGRKQISTIQHSSHHRLVS